MVGDKAKYDVFISYRVAADASIAGKLYDELVARGLTPYLDSKCLEAGVNWEKGFCDGLARSLTFVSLISRGSINHPTVERQNFKKLRKDSPIDNVLLEMRLAMELQAAGLVPGVFPVSE